MESLLDTHTFIWWVTNDSKLSAAVTAILSDPSNTIYFSAASAWEMAIKVQLGKLKLDEEPAPFIDAELAKNHFKPLAIDVRHAVQTYSLPLLHRDPFDRLLIAQSVVEDLPILTTDSLIAKYGVRTIW